MRILTRSLERLKSAQQDAEHSFAAALDFFSAGSGASDTLQLLDYTADVPKQLEVAYRPQIAASAVN